MSLSRWQKLIANSTRKIVPSRAGAVATEMAGVRREGEGAVASSKALLRWWPLAASAIGATSCGGIHTPSGGAPVCQNTSIGMPPRGYQ